MNTPIDRRRFLAATSVTAVASNLLGAVTPGTTTETPIKVGQIGTAHSHAAGKWETINRFSDLFEVVGIVEPDPERRKAATRRYGDPKWITDGELFDQATLVVVETDVPELVATAKRAVDAGKHLHLDKPGGTNLADFAELLKAAEQRDLVIQMGYMFRYNPAFQFLFQAVRNGWLGTIREVNGAIGKQGGDGLRKNLSRYPGGGMFELACHLIDALVTVIGAATAVHAFNRETRDDGFVDNQLAVFEYPDATATIRCNHVDPFGGPRRQFSVIGDQGSIEIRPLEPPKLTLMIDRPHGDYAKGTHLVGFESGGRYDGDFQDLAAVLSGKKEFDWGYAHDLAVQRAVLLASGMKVD